MSNQQHTAETLLSPSILEAIPDAVAAVNQQGIIVQVDAQTEAMFGYTRQELIGQPIEILIPQRQRKQHDSHRERFTRNPNSAVWSPAWNSMALAATARNSR